MLVIRWTLREVLPGRNNVESLHVTHILNLLFRPASVPVIFPTGL